MGRMVGLIFMLLLAGCSGGAVVFAPTPLPPDVSAVVYTHPGGAFSVTLPRNWPVHEQNTTVLASAAFSAPGADQPALRFAVMNLGKPLNSTTLAQVMDRYQTQIRPDAKLYQEKSVSNITFNAPVSGNINVAGHSINAQAMSLSLTEMLSKIEASNVAAPEKEAAKSKLADFLSHPVVAAIVGGLASKVGG